MVENKIEKVENLLRELVTFPCSYCAHNKSREFVIVIDDNGFPIDYEMPEPCKICVDYPYVSFALNKDVECNIDCEDCHLGILGICVKGGEDEARKRRNTS